MGQDDTVLVGFGTADITPGAGGELSGFALRSGPSIGTHDPLSARAVAVCDEPDGPGTALVALDLVGLDISTTNRIRARVEQEVGIPAGNVIVAVTHTHCGPAVMPGRPSMGATDPQYLRLLDDAAVAAVATAWRNRKRGTLRFGIGEETTVSRNRRTPGGITDPDVPVIRAQDATGTVLGVICGYACHPTSLGPSNLSVSADFPGVVRNTLEAVYPGSTTVYANGCGGQIASAYRVRTYAESMRLGRTLAGTVIRTAEHATVPTQPEHQSQVAARAVPVSLPRLPILSPDELTTELAQWRQEVATTLVPNVDPGALALARFSIAWAERLLERRPAQENVDTTVAAFRWGGIGIVSLPGEPFVELGLEIKNRIGIPIMVVGYANGSPGYVPHRSAYPGGGYEVCEAHRFYDEPSAFAPEAGEILVEAAIAALRGVGLGRAEATV